MDGEEIKGSELGQTLKRPNLMMVVLVTAVLSGSVVGGIVYAWQRGICARITESLEVDSARLQQLLTASVNTYQLPSPDVEQEVAESPMPVPASYDIQEVDGIKTFMAGGFSFQFPSEWREDVKVTSGGIGVQLFPLQGEGEQMDFMYVNISLNFGHGLVEYTVVEEETVVAGGVEWPVTYAVGNTLFGDNTERSVIVTSYWEEDLEYGMEARYDQVNDVVMRAAFSRVLSSVAFE